jgi:hypothetical protein
LSNLVRFFIDKNEFVDSKYKDIPIPQIGSTVFLNDEPFKVKNITYDFIESENDYNMIDVFVEHMEDENF